MSFLISNNYRIGTYIGQDRILVRKKEREKMTDSIREISTWLAIIGIPTIFSLTTWCVRECVKFTKKLNILHSAQKAQMRSQLLEQYYSIINRGYVWSDELDDWINQYKAYHELVGENGVLDARKTELEHFPSQVR